MQPHLPLAGAIAASLFWLALLSALETAVRMARRSRLTLLAGPAPDVREQQAETMREFSLDFLTAVHIGRFLGMAVLYAASGVLLFRIIDPGPERRPWWEVFSLAALAAAAAAIVTGILSDTLPRRLAGRNPERTLLAAIGFIRAYTAVCTPLVWLLRSGSRTLLLRREGEPGQSPVPAQSEEEIRLLVEGSAEEGLLEEEERELIHSVFEFTGSVARQVMTPRIHVHSISREATIDDVADLALASGHSRFPVYEETLDHVVGIVHVKDVLPLLRQGKGSQGLDGLLRDPLFVPEGRKLDELLQDLRRARSQMAIVVDEFGGTSGLVTVEDLLEELVGEIEDEYDPAGRPDVEPEDSGAGATVEARAPIEDVNEALGLSLPRGDYDTLGGFVFSLFGRPPAQGEEIDYGNVRFIVEETEGNRLVRVRLKLLTETGPAAGEATASGS